MQVVIEINKEDFEIIKHNVAIGNPLCPIGQKEMITKIANGTPLPKGHGRLIDVGDLMPDSDYEDGIFYAVSIGMINGAPTIIEADKAENEDEE